MNGIFRDLRYAARALARSPSYTVTAIATLALGTAALTAAFAVAWHVLAKPLPWPDAERLVQIWNTAARTGSVNVLAPANYLDIERDAESFDAVGAYSHFTTPLNLTGAGQPVDVRIRAVTGGYFQVFRTFPQRGRTITQADADRDAPLIVISNGLWRRQFGARPDVVGQVIRLDDRPYAIVGVMPADFDVAPRPIDGWVPYHFTADLRERRLGYFLGAVGRLAPGVGVSRAREEVEAIARRAAERFPTSNREIGATLRSLREELAGHSRTGLLLLAGSSVLVLLVACVNVTSLQLARLPALQREMAVRAALGATRGRLVRLVLLEGLMVAAAAGVAGLLAGFSLVEALVALAPPTAAMSTRLSADAPVVASVLLVSVVSALVLFCLPAWRATRFAPSDALRGRGRSDRASGHLRSALVTTEVALATTLLSGTLVLIASLANVLQVDLGFDPDGVVVADLRLPQSRYATAERQAQFFDALFARLDGRPGIERTCATNAVPLETAVNMTFVPEGTRLPIGALPVTVSPGCFDALGISLRGGRLFDRYEPEPVAIVSEGYARRAFPGIDPIGRLIRVGVPAGERLTIVGIVADSRRRSIEGEALAQVYQPLHQSPYFLAAHVLVRSSGSAREVVTALQHAVREVDPSQPVGNLRLLGDVVGRAMGSRVFTLSVLGGFAAIAVLLAAVGVYGLLTQIVALRRQEIGVRMALGARANAIVRLVTGGAIGLVLIGVALGLGGAWLASRLLSRFVFGVSPTDPALLAAAAAVLVAVSAAAAFTPVRRATRVNPLQALRDD